MLYSNTNNAPKREPIAIRIALRFLCDLLKVYFRRFLRKATGEKTQVDQADCQQRHDRTQQDAVDRRTEARMQGSEERLGQNAVAAHRKQQARTAGLGRQPRGELAEVAPEHFELTEYYQRYFRLNVVADEIQFNCYLPDGRTLCLSLIQPWVLSLLRQRLLYELNQVSAPQPLIQNDDWDAQLTARELDVGRLMLSGCSSKEIARKLEISVETVKVHKKRMYSTLGIKSQSELFSIFLQAQNA